MALTFSSGMTIDDTAQAITNWGGFALAGAIDRAPAVITSHGAMGPNSIGLASTWTNIDSVVIMYDYFTSHASTALDLTAVGNEVLAIWFHLADPGLIDTLANGGVYIIASSSTDTGATVPTAYRRWYVSGNNVLRTTAKGPWYLAMIDTRKAASVADVGVFSLTSVHRYGIGSKNVITELVGGPPPENLFCGGAMHGRPIYQVIGDGSTTATWNDILTHSLTTQQNGLIEDHAGSYKLSCGIRFGSATQAATTTFSDATNPTFVFKRNTYYNAGEDDALNYSDYYIVDAQGAASFKTSVTLGTVVGTGNARQGVKGTSFLTSDQTKITFSANFTSANLTAVNLYGTRWVGAKGGLQFDSSTIGLLISNVFQRSGKVDCGLVSNGAVLFNSTIIDPEGGTAQNYGLMLPSTHNIKNISFITSAIPTTQHMLDLSSSGTYTDTMDNIQFFGTYSGTILHGDLSSATLTTVTGAATNGANPDATKFSKTGNASSSITIQNSVTLTVTIQDITGIPLPNIRVSIYKPTAVVSGSELLQSLTNASGVATATFNFISNQSIIIRIRGGTPSISSPVNAAFATAATGGSLSNGTYYYRVSAINDIGETIASPQTSITLSAGTATQTITVNWSAVTGATGYRIYGRATNAELFIASVGVVTTYLDTGSITPSGALPSSNTTQAGRYFPIDTSGNITSSGYSALFTLVKDTVASTTAL